jgi:hypothetical protein
MLDAQLSKDLTIVNGVGATTGKVGGARTFAMASSQYAYGDFAASTTYSILFWFNATSIGADRVACGWSNASGSQWSGIPFLTSGNKFAFYIYDTGAGGRTVTGSTTISTGVTYHGAVTVGSQVKLYLNGALDTTAVTLTAPPFSSWSDGPRFSAGACVPGLFGTYFDGWLDQLIYDDTELSGADIAAVYNSGAGTVVPISGGGMTSFRRSLYGRAGSRSAA